MGWTRVLIGVVAIAALAGLAAWRFSTPEPVRPVGRPPIGNNLSSVVDWSTQTPFVDLFRQSRAWISGRADGTWDDGRTVAVDERGWVRSLEPGQVARSIVIAASARDRFAGVFRVAFAGTGDVRVGGAPWTSTGPGRLEFTLTPGERSGEYVTIELHASDPSDPVRDVRVLLPGAPDEPPAIAFNPVFLDRTRGFSPLRFMDWQATNGSELSAWADRPDVGDARWTGRGGVPVEVMVALCNELKADAWFCMPHLADDDFVRAFARLVDATLDVGLTVYVEHSNEVWNDMFPQAVYALERGRAAALSDHPREAQLAWHARRSGEIFAIWKAEVRPGRKIVRVLGTHAAAAWATQQVLRFSGEADALAIAPYFGHDYGTPAMKPAVEAMTPDELLAVIERDELPKVAEQMRMQRRLAERAGLRLLAYEAGQHLAGSEGRQDDPALNELFDAANRSAKMGELYDAYLAAWRESGGGDVLVNFADCAPMNKWGRWGALEWIGQAEADAPKYGALRRAMRSP